MTIYLDPLSMGYATLKLVSCYFLAETKIQQPEIDHSFGKRENFPINFSLLKEPSDSNSISVYTMIALPIRHVAVVNSAFLTLPNPSQRFILLHECGHMKNGDVHFSIIADIVSAIAASILFPVHPFLATLGISLVFRAFLSSIQERRADSFAIAHSSTEELKGGIEVLEQQQKNNIQSWLSSTSFLSKMDFIISTFTYCVLEGHPLASSRIEKIQKELDRRKNLSLPDFLYTTQIVTKV